MKLLSVRNIFHGLRAFVSTDNQAGTSRFQIFGGVSGINVTSQRIYVLKDFHIRLLSYSFLGTAGNINQVNFLVSVGLTDTVQCLNLYRFSPSQVSAAPTSDFDLGDVTNTWRNVAIAQANATIDFPGLFGVLPPGNVWPNTLRDVDLNKLIGVPAVSNVSPDNFPTDLHFQSYNYKYLGFAVSFSLPNGLPTIGANTFNVNTLVCGALHEYALD